MLRLCVGEHKSELVRALVNVTCCYNLLSEESTAEESADATDAAEGSGDAKARKMSAEDTPSARGRNGGDPHTEVLLYCMYHCYCMCHRFHDVAI